VDYTPISGVSSYYNSALFNTNWEPVKNAQGQSMYDIQRQQLGATAQNANTQRLEALQRQMAAQGLQGSGIDLRQQAVAQNENLQQRMAGEQNIGIAELTAAENSRQAAMAREFTSENQLTGLNAQVAISNAANALQAKIASGQLNLAAQGLTLDQAKTMGYTDPVTGQHVMGSLEIQKYTEDNKATLMNLADQLTRGQMSYAAAIALDKQTNDVTANDYYTRGINGEQIPAADLETLRTTNPLAYQSYQLGLAGKTRQDLDTLKGLFNSERESLLATGSYTAAQVGSMYNSWIQDYYKSMAPGAGNDIMAQNGVIINSAPVNTTLPQTQQSNLGNMLGMPINLNVPTADYWNNIFNPGSIVFPSFPSGTTTATTVPARQRRSPR
jgi:hypothetical protein